MTESEWLQCAEPGAMLSHLQQTNVHRSKVGRRLLRLFACACARRVWHLLDEERIRHGVRTSEAFADGQASKEALSEAERGASPLVIPARPPRRVIHGPRDPQARKQSADSAAWMTCVSRAWLAAEGGQHHAAVAASGREPPTASELAAQCDLLRDIFGNPFRPVAVDPSWLTSAVVGVACGAYADRAFDRLPILADALQDAGCENADILDHCHSPGPHVRGCWVVDLVLGKE